MKYCSSSFVQKKCSKPWNVQLFLKSIHPGAFLHSVMQEPFSACWETWGYFSFFGLLKGESLANVSLQDFVQTLSTSFQISLSSFGNFSASGAATQLTPDCSSALGLYVPSVCLFFFTTQKSQARTAKTMARTPRMTVGATIAAMSGPCKWKNTRRWSIWGHWILSGMIHWSW